MIETTTFQQKLSWRTTGGTVGIPEACPTHVTTRLSLVSFRWGTRSGTRAALIGIIILLFVSLFIKLAVVFFCCMVWKGELQLLYEFLGYRPRWGTGTVVLALVALALEGGRSEWGNQWRDGVDLERDDVDSDFG